MIVFQQSLRLIANETRRGLKRFDRFYSNDCNVLCRNTTILCIYNNLFLSIAWLNWPHLYKESNKIFSDGDQFKSLMQSSKSSVYLNVKHSFQNGNVTSE